MLNYTSFLIQRQTDRGQDQGQDQRQHNNRYKLSTTQSDSFTKYEEFLKRYGNLSM